MKQEREVLFFDVNKEAIREKLIEIKAQKIYSEFLQKRVVFDFGQKDDVFSWVRIRQEKDKVVMSYKETKKNDFANEVEVVVSNFEDTVIILEKSGLAKSSYQENYREKYMYKNSEIVIDTWPWLEPVVEVESPSQEELDEVILLLGLSKDKSFMGSINNVYHLKFGKWIQELTREQQMRFTFNENNQFLL